VLEEVAGLALVGHIVEERDWKAVVDILEVVAVWQRGGDALLPDAGIDLAIN
jgi:hypothetical protein